MSKTVSLRILENDDEDADLLNEVGDAYPPFEFQRFGSANGAHIYLVHAAGEFIGSLHLTHDQISGQEKWSIAFVESQKRHTHVPVISKEEGAEKLWQDRMGIIQLPNTPPHYEPLGPVPDDPDHYESLRKTAGKLVSFLAEEEGEDEDDFADTRDLAGDQREMIVSALKDAGFKIIRADYVDNKGTNQLTLEFSWPAPNAPTYVLGWRRAKEAMQPFLPLRHENYKVRKEGEGNGRIAIATVVKRAEENPNLWKVVQHSGQSGGAEAWYDIYFNGKVAGEAYLTAFSGIDDFAEHLREELSELNDIVPFDPKQWFMGGNAWGRGPAINWWRKNRSRLSNASPYTFNKDLLGEQ